MIEHIGNLEGRCSHHQRIRASMQLAHGEWGVHSPGASIVVAAGCDTDALDCPAPVKDSGSLEPFVAISCMAW